MSEALLAAARSASAVPIVRVRVADRDVGVLRLRWSRWYQGDEPDGPVGAASPVDGSLVRARIDPADGALLVQRVATPSADADYTAWSALTTAEADAGIGCHAAGARVAIAYFDGSAVHVRTSADFGANFGSAAALAFDAGVTAVACAIRADGSVAVVWASGGTVYSVTRSGLGAWGSPAAWSRSLASVNALAMADHADWAVLVSGEDGDGQAGAWTTRLGSGLDAPPGTWSPLAPVILASPGTDVTYRATAVATIGEPRLALVEAYAGTGAFHRAMLSTAVLASAYAGGAWRDPRPLDRASPFGVALAASGAHAYLCTADGVWHAPATAPYADLTALVAGARYESDERGERLRLVLDASADAALSALAPGMEIAFAPGYATPEGEAVVADRLLWITAVERSQRDGRAVIEVEAASALGVLRRWRAARQVQWPAGARTILGIAQDVAQLAGVTVAIASPSLAATTLTPAFTVRAGEDGVTALTRLFSRTPDLLLARGGELRVHEPDPGAEPGAAYGSDFPVRACGSVDVAGETGWARLFGAGAFAQAFDLDRIERGAGVTIVIDETATDAGLTAARAVATLRRAGVERETAWIEAAPHPGQERGDVIEVSHPVLGAEARSFRVTSIRVDYARRPRGRYEMRLGLGEL